MTPTAPHTPVMAAEVVAALAPRPDGLYVDGTFGRGGYARALLATPQARVVGLDRDPDAVAAGQDMVAAFAPRLTLLQGEFGRMDHLLAARGFGAVDGVALDLGVSSPQLDEAERGFSFQKDGPLDMRMSRAGESAADIVNTRDEKSLADIFFQLGEERHARRVARRIVEARKQAPITRTGELAALVRQAVPRSADGIDPATRSFQALRLAVNDEMGELDRGLRAAERLLKPGGRLVVVAFHSLEDRRVKDFLRARSADAPQASRHAPGAATPGRGAPSFRLLARKPLVPSAAECAANPRARSARLRSAERTDAPALPSASYGDRP